MPHTTKDTATVHAKCLVKMEKKLAMVLSTVSGIYLGLLGCILYTSGGLLDYICNFQEKLIHELQAELVAHSEYVLKPMPTARMLTVQTHSVYAFILQTGIAKAGHFPLTA